MGLDAGFLTYIQERVKMVDLDGGFLMRIQDKVERGKGGMLLPMVHKREG